MRKELFHMERDVLNIGDSVTIIEGQLPFFVLLYNCSGAGYVQKL